LHLPKNKSGRILVTPELSVQGLDGVWALGDCAQVPTLDGGVAPPTAQHATRRPKVLARQPGRTIRGRACHRVFSLQGAREDGSLGAASGGRRRVRPADLRRPGVVPLAHHLSPEAAGVRPQAQKVPAGCDFDLFLPPELVQFRFFANQQLLLREHFEPGQEVSARATLGDRIYAISTARRRW